jgi:uncharacterized LabA/DUF88 family protein
MQLVKNNEISEMVFKKYLYVQGRFQEVNSELVKNEIQCNFCDGTFFILIERGGKEYLECRCGNKISNETVSFVRKSHTEKYQKLLESIDELKDDFLIKIRAENTNTSNERIGIFVDVQNIYYGAKDSFNGKIDFKKLLTNILKERKLVIANAYMIDSNVNNKSFVSCLKQIGYEIKSKELRVRTDGSAKGNTDIELTIDALNIKDKLDTVALVSGDGDFVPLVEFLKSKNMKVEVYSFSVYKNSTAFDLKQVASRFFEIDETYLFSEKKEE